MIWPANALPSSCVDHPEEVSIMLKRFVSTALVGLVALALVPARADAQGSAPVEIGVVEPLSGPVAASAHYVHSEAGLARDGVDAGGGQKGRTLVLQFD